MDHQKTSKLFAKIVKGIAETGDLHGHSKIVISSHIESYPIYTYVKRCQEMSRDVKRCQEMSRDVKRITAWTLQRNSDRTSSAYCNLT